MTSSWTVYYRAGRVFGSRDGTWGQAPADGVLAVVYTIDDARKIASGGDYYRLCDDGSVICHETADAILHAIGHVEMSAIKFGWCVGPSEMAAVFKRIEDDSLVLTDRGIDRG